MMRSSAENAEPATAQPDGGMQLEVGTPDPASSRAPDAVVPPGGVRAMPEPIALRAHVMSPPPPELSHFEQMIYIVPNPEGPGDDAPQVG